MEKLYIKFREKLENWGVVNEWSPSLEEACKEAEKLGYKKNDINLEWYWILKLCYNWYYITALDNEKILILHWNTEHKLNSDSDKIKELEKRIEELEGKSKPVEDIIKVPDNIKIVEDNFSLNLINWNQSMYWGWKTYWISSYAEDLFIETKLVKCNYEDIEAGEFFYCSDNWLVDIDDLEYYSLKLEDNSYQYWCDKDCRNSIGALEDYYKVEII